MGRGLRWRGRDNHSGFAKATYARARAVTRGLRVYFSWNNYEEIVQVAATSRQVLFIPGRRKYFTRFSIHICLAYCNYNPNLTSRRSPDEVTEMG